jgi:hypothetical protein
VDALRKATFFSLGHNEMKKVENPYFKALWSYDGVLFYEGFLVKNRPA